MDAQAQQLVQLEQCCNAMYNGTPDDRRKAHDMLIPLVSSIENIAQIQYVLGNSSNMHALIFASSGLRDLLTKNWARVPQVQRDETKEFLLSYLAQRGPQLVKGAPDAVQPFIRLLCRIIKLSWLDGPSHQLITQQVEQFLNASTIHYTIG